MLGLRGLTFVLCALAALWAPSSAGAHAGMSAAVTEAALAGDTTDPTAQAAAEGGASGPCTDAAKDAMPNGEGHDHKDISQHRFRCRMEQVAFLSLKEQLASRPDVILGEMDVKADVAAVGVAYPESGILFFDVSDPSRPVFKSWYRGSECEATVIDIDCGAFVDLSSDGKTAFLSVQSLSVVPGIQPPEGGIRPASEPGVEVVDVRNIEQPRLTQAYPVVSLGGVHTSRSHVIPAEGSSPRAPGEYLFSVANVENVEVTKLNQTPAGPQLSPVNRIPVDELHDMFVQNDPITGRTYLYLAGGYSSGFLVYDVTNPADEQLLGRWDLTPECGSDWYSHTIDVTYRGNRRYVTLPAELFEGGESSAADRAKGCGDVDGNGDRVGPLWIIDASDFSKLGGPHDTPAVIKAKSQDTLTSTWTNPAGRHGGNLTFSPHNQQVVGDKIYLSHYHGGVYVLDASAAFAGRSERPTELGFIVPHGEETRPLHGEGTAAVGPVIRFFTGFPLGRPEIWDMQFYKGYVLAADMTGGFYSLRFDGDVPPGGSAPGSQGEGSSAAGPGRRFRLSKRPVRPNSRRVLRVRGKCESPVTCRGILRVRARVAGKRITVARKRFAVAAGVRRGTNLRVKPRKFRRLQRSGATGARAIARLSNDAAGNPALTVRRGFRLLRPRG